MQLDAHRPAVFGHPYRVPARERAVREPEHSVDLPRRVGGVASEDLRRNRRLTGHATRLAPSQCQFRRLGPRGEAERDERRAETGGDVHDRRGAPVDAARVRRPGMRQEELSAGVRQRDLTGVHVTGEDEVEAAGLEPVEDAREVA